MPINDLKPSLYVQIRVPGGCGTFDITAAQLARYAKDPDAVAADIVGLTLEEYAEWVELDGAPLCAATTRSGKLCRNQTDRSQLSATAWIGTHGKFHCSVHGGEAADLP